MKRILVTGANRGIGLEFVRQYAKRGDRVFAATRRPAEAETLQELAAQYPGQVEIVTLDTGNEASIQAAYEAVRSKTDALDLLINNAGVAHGGTWEKSEQFGTLEMDTVLNIFRVNSVGPALITQQFLPLLQAAGEGAIAAAVSSGLGSLTQKPQMTFAISYSASKAALNMYLRTIAFLPEAQGVTVVALDPGWVQTDMGGKNATLTPEQSVSGQIRVLDGLTPERTGLYLAWDGSEVPW